MTDETNKYPEWMHQFFIKTNGSCLQKLKKDNEKVNDNCFDNKLLMINSNKKSMVSIKLVVESQLFDRIIEKNEKNINHIKTNFGVIINIVESENNSNIIHIEGRENKVELAKNELEKMIYKLKNEVEKKILIDQHYHRVLIGVQGRKIKQFQKEFNVKVEFPNEVRNNLVKIRGLSEDVNKASKSLAELAKKLDEANYVLEIPIFKNFYKFIDSNGEANILKIGEETGTRIDLPHKDKDSDTIKVMGSKEKVLIACDMIKNIQNKMGDIVTKEVTWRNDKVHNIIANLKNKLIQFFEDFGNVTLKVQTDKWDNKIIVKGPEDDVDNVIAQIHTMIDEAHTLVDIKVESEFYKYFIKNKQTIIKRFQDLTNTRIIFPLETDSTNENITIVGKKENINKAKSEFEAMIIDLSIVIEEYVDINEKYIDLVVKQGEFLRRLEDECDTVNILFPLSDTGNKMVLIGSKANVALVKQKILDHVKTMENTIQIKINVEPKFHYHFVGRWRSNVINEIIDDCNGVSITFPKVSSKNNVVIIEGDKTNVQEAKRRIEEIVKDLENIVKITMSIPPKYHRHFVAQQAKVIKQIRAEYNGITVSFPQRNSNSSEVVIKGHKDYIENVKIKINAIVQDLITGVQKDIDKVGVNIKEEIRLYDVDNEKEQQCSYKIQMTIKSEFHPLILGEKGITIRNLCKKYGVQINLPRRGNGNNKNIITVIGCQQNVKLARDKIQEMVDKCNNVYKEEIYIDSRIHSRLIGFRGRNILQIMDTYHVDIRFSKSDSDNLDLVIIYSRAGATQDNVFDCMDHLKTIQQVYLADLLDSEAKENQKPKSDNQSVSNGGTNHNF